MKKYLSLILVMALLSSMLCMGVSAEFTGPTTASTNVPDSIPLDVTLGLTGSVAHRYSVDIEYTGDMKFTFNANGISWVVGKESYSYDEGNSGWTDADQTLTIINHSDLKLGYTVTMAKETEYDALTFTLNDAEQATGTLAACTTLTPFGTIKESVEVVVEGDIPVDASNNDKMGTLTIAFSAVN